MNRKAWVALPFAAVLGFSLAGCAGDADTGAPVDDTPSAPASQPAEETPAEETAPPSDGANDADAGADLTAVALAAIATAEDEVGGTAYAIDDQDFDGTWEVEVATGNGSVEVTVDESGTEVLRTHDDDFDRDDRAALDAASITLQEAIEIAIADQGGVLDDAELGEDDGRIFWEITLDDGSRNDIEVSVDARSGDVFVEYDY